MLERIIENKIRCKHCDTIIESKHRHDYQMCKCGKVSVDGGHMYLRRGFMVSPDDYEDLSIIEEVQEEPEEKEEQE